MADRRLPLAENVVPGKRLGRHIHHDARSLRYLVPALGVAATQIWERKIPILDQGNLGSCTGNAIVGALGTGPTFDALTPVQRAALNEDEAVRIYSLATQLDGFQGTYPPTDTGSDGLDAAKAAQKLGYLSGYQHITSIPAAQTAILSGPFITGVNWYSSMDEPNADGLVTVGGQIRGGHEFCCYGYDAQADLWWFANSWGEGWGKAGTFCMSSASYARLLSEQGDATVLVPITQPAPTPTPTPGPAQPTDPSYVAWQQHVQPVYAEWKQHMIKYRRPLEAAIDAWLANGD